MPAIDVVVEIAIEAAPADVAAVMFDPAREPEWVSAVKSVDILTAGLMPGARVRHRSRIFGMDVSWTSEVTASDAPHHVTYRISEGPFNGVLEYVVTPTAHGAAVRVRNAGDIETGIPIPGAIVSRKVNAALTADLGRLKALLEKDAAPR